MEQDRRGKAPEREKVRVPVMGKGAAAWADLLLPASEEIVYARIAGMLSRICRDSHVTRKDVPRAGYH